jgi:hypothetical protein
VDPGKTRSDNHLHLFVGGFLLAESPNISAQTNPPLFHSVPLYACCVLAKVVQQKTNWCTLPKPCLTDSQNRSSLPPIQCNTNTLQRRYLTDVASGGETVFPNVPAPPSQTLEAGYSECAMQGLAYRPRRGDAIAFWSLRTDGTLDKGSLHGSCPIISGEKYAATKWFHVAHYAVGGEEAVTVRHVVHRPPPPPAPPGCRDLHPDCPGWAEGGECDHNPGYMVGDDDEPGSCLLSCGRCDLMPRSRVFR